MSNPVPTQLSPWAIGGYVVGALGFLYGLWRDQRLRQIEKRAKAPHFVYVESRYDAEIEAPKSVVYCDPPTALEDSGHRLMNLRRAPNEYPAQRVISVIVRNVGAKLRYLTVESQKEEIVFQTEGMALYEVRYRHGGKNKNIDLTMKFETAEGTWGRQKWRICKADHSVVRTKPRLRA